MAGRIREALDRWHLRKLQERWARGLADAGAETFALRALRSEAREARRGIDRVIAAADERMVLPGLNAALPRTPLGTDWAWRADAWRKPLSRPGLVAEDKRSQIGEGLALYHDCPLGEIAVRQLRNTSEADRAPFGLALEVMGFRGSFLSLATNLPEQAVNGLKSKHVIRLDAVIGVDRPVRIFARLNVKHGPNVAQLVQEWPSEAGARQVEFDLAYAGIDDGRIERAWLDLIFNEAANSRITLRDLVLSRRPRAEA